MNIKDRLIQKAIEKHGKNISPYVGTSLRDNRNYLFSKRGLLFWFNDNINSTHIVKCSYEGVLS